MPFDPTLPATGSKLRSAEMRDNFNGLKDLIDAQQATIASQQALIVALQTQMNLAPPVLAFDPQDATSVHFYAADNPPKWFWEFSYDGGASWSPDNGFNSYGDTYDGPEDKGTLMRARRADGSNNPYGPYSNVLTYP